MKKSITSSEREQLLQIRTDALRHLRAIDRLHAAARRILDITPSEWPMADDHIQDMLNSVDVDDTLELLGVKVRP